MAGTVRPFSLPKRPPNHLGSYGFALSGATLAAAPANTPYFSFRWSSASAFCVIRAVDVRLFTQSATTASGFFGAFIARAFTASDTGGTAVAQPFSKRTTYPASLVSDVRFSDGAALTPGTRTLDANPFVGHVTPNGLQTPIVPGAFGGAEAGDPIVLAQNEGIVVNNISALGAGIVRFYIRLEWMELDATHEF